MFATLGGTLILFDGPDGYRPSEDSFWLAAFAPKVKGPLCDIGCGSGAVGLAYLSKQKTTSPLVGFDIHPHMVQAAKKAAAYNKINSHFLVADVLSPPFKAQTFMLTLSNPPFFNEAREMPSANKQNLRNKFALHPLTLWLETMVNLTQNNGRVALIVHKKDEGIIIEKAAALNCSLVKAFMLQTTPNKPGKRVILDFIKQNHAQTPAFETIHTYDKKTRATYLKEAL